MLPIWDVIFGTYCLPETNREVKFGLGTGEEKEFQTILDLYILPIKKAGQLINAEAPEKAALRVKD